MNAWQREKMAYEDFTLHCDVCPVCSHERPTYPLCDEGLKLEKAWGLADAVAQRAEQEADEKADYLGEYPTTDAPRWDHSDDWKPGR